MSTVSPETIGRPVPAASVVVSVLLPGSVRGYAQLTDVSDLISCDTTWTFPVSPYQVTGNIQIQSGARVTIEAGVDVVFNAQLGMMVYGELEAVETAAARLDWREIEFGDYTEFGFHTPWGVVYKRGSGFLTMSHHTVWSRGRHGMNVQGNSGTVMVDDLAISGRNGPGISVIDSGGTTVVTGAVLSGNVASGLYLGSSVMTVSGSTFGEKGQYGILKEINKSVLLEGNAFVDNPLGELGRSYGFFSLAVDRIGNRETKPISVEASTTTAYIVKIDPTARHYEGVQFGSDGVPQYAPVSDSELSVRLLMQKVQNKMDEVSRQLRDAGRAS